MGAFIPNVTSRSGCAYGRSRNRMRSTMVKTAVVAPTRSALVPAAIRNGAGAAIPNCRITFRTESTGLNTEVTSNPMGLFVSPPLRAGSYVVEVQATGFDTAAKRVRLDLSERVDLEFELTVGAISSKVVVQ